MGVGASGTWHVSVAGSTGPAGARGAGGPARHSLHALLCGTVDFELVSS